MPGKTDSKTYWGLNIKNEPRSDDFSTSPVPNLTHLYTQWPLVSHRFNVRKSPHGETIPARYASLEVPVPLDFRFSGYI